MQIFSLPDMKLLSVVEGVDCLQPVMSAEPPRRSNSREALKEVLVADLGVRWANSPYLIVRFPATNCLARDLIYDRFEPTTMTWLFTSQFSNRQRPRTDHRTTYDFSGRSTAVCPMSHRGQHLGLWRTGSGRGHCEFFPMLRGFALFSCLEVLPGLFYERRQAHHI